MGPRPLNIVHSFSAGIVFRRQILTSKDGPRAEGVKPITWYSCKKKRWHNAVLMLEQMLGKNWMHFWYSRQIAVLFLLFLRCPNLPFQILLIEWAIFKDFVGFSANTVIKTPAAYVTINSRGKGESSKF